MDQKIAIVSLSGGMDSTGLLMHLLARGYQAFGLSFDYGQKHKIEIQRLRRNLDYLASHGIQVEHNTVDISVLGSLFHSALTDESWSVPKGFYEQENMKETVVPNRNAIFSSIAYGYALSIANRFEQKVILTLGVHSGDHAIYPDCRPEFYDELHKAFQTGNWDSERVEFYLPYIDGDKFTILKDAQESISKLGLDFETVFRNTCTSYEPDAEGRSNGQTGSDVERILAFHKLGVRDPIEYVQPWEEVLDQALSFEKEANS